MPSEREIDNYIDSIEEENVIYVDKELEYANKCHKLEEEIGCPLECMVAVFNAIKQGYIFCDIGNGMYEENYIQLDYGDISIDEEPIFHNCATSSNYHYVLDNDGCIFVEDYKKTWWLREDKSE